MIREMLTFGVLPGDFEQSGTCPDLYFKFPKGQRHNSQWVTAFEEFVDELVLQKMMTQAYAAFSTACHTG